VLAIIIAALIGLSRLYLGMHFPSDVVCGFLVGMICATLVYTIIIAIEKKRGIIGGPQHKDPAATE
jgi:undecaprenyl-diphosphatase